jgi:hypothetical protein
VIRYAPMISRGGKTLNRAYPELVDALEQAAR